MMLENSIFQELIEKKDRIIEEGDEYLKFIYSNLSRKPKRVFSFLELVEGFDTLRAFKSKNEIVIKGVNKFTRKQETIVKSRNKELFPVFTLLVQLFITYKVIEHILPIVYEREFKKVSVW